MNCREFVPIVIETDADPSLLLSARTKPGTHPVPHTSVTVDEFFSDEAMHCEHCASLREAYETTAATKAAAPAIRIFVVRFDVELQREGGVSIGRIMETSMVRGGAATRSRRAAKECDVGAA
jgi:hypothetical protein